MRILNSRTYRLTEVLSKIHWYESTYLTCMATNNLQLHCITNRKKESVILSSSSTTDQVNHYIIIQNGSTSRWSRKRVLVYNYCEFQLHPNLTYIQRDRTPEGIISIAYVWYTITAENENCVDIIMCLLVTVWNSKSRNQQISKKWMMFHIWSSDT